MFIKFCPECGHKAEESFNFCPSCGLNFSRKETLESPGDPGSSSHKGLRSPVKDYQEFVFGQDDPSCSPLMKVIQSEESASCSPGIGGTQKCSPNSPINSEHFTRNALKRRGSCVSEKEDMEFSPKKCESKGATSPLRKKGKNIKLEPLPENEILSDNSSTEWVLTKVMAQEKTGIFYEAHSKLKPDRKEHCILKLDTKDGKIFNEQNFFQRAAKKITVDKWKKSRACPALGIPTCIGFGVHEKYRFLVFSALGQNLQDIINKNQKIHAQDYTLSDKAVYQIVYRMIDALEYVHENEYVHGDITAENIFVNPENYEVYLGGYHNAYRYSPAGKHVEYREGSRTPHEGTAEFISLDIHKGTGPSRRSDLQSLGYCMLKWIRGSLPWSQETKVCSIMEHKERFNSDVPGQLRQCFNRKKVPDVLKNYLEYVMSLDYKDKPDYEKIRNNISTALKMMNVKPYDPINI